MIDQNFIRHILGAIERIESYTVDLTESDFMKDFMVQDAVIRNLEIIGEASKKITVQTKEKNSNIPWKQISGMRDKLIHNYFGVDLISVWSVIQRDLGVLKKELTKLNAD